MYSCNLQQMKWYNKLLQSDGIIRFEMVAMKLNFKTLF